MLRDAMPSLMPKGYILIVILIVLFVLTVLATAANQHFILSAKMQNNMREYDTVFWRAALGRQQQIAQLEGKTFSLPDSTISLQTSQKSVSMDHCGNQTVDLQSIAKNAFSTVILNSRDIFARVPPERGCQIIPQHQIVWWQEY